jgi:hypothetical protein
VTLNGDEEDNLRTVQERAREAWNDGLPVCAVPLMMDIYYMFSAPLGVGDHAPYAVADAERTLDLTVARGQLEAELATADVPDAWRRKILEEVDRPHVDGRGGWESWGLRRHRERLTELVERHNQEAEKIFPFLAVDPRRPGAIDAATSGAFVGKSGPFYGIKLYPRLGYDPRVPALRPLFAWCAANDIPVTTHCGPSGFPAWDDQHAALGHPANYRSVLDEHRALRINFAHFGSMDATWAAAIIAAMRRFPGRVFADLSCYTGTAQPDEFLRRHRRDWDDPIVRRHTMLGTDFDVMYLTQVGRDLRSYYRQFLDAFPRSDLDAMTTHVPECFLRVA